jgi:hypothetical protein
MRTAMLVTVLLLAACEGAQPQPHTQALGIDASVGSPDDASAGPCARPPQLEASDAAPTACGSARAAVSCALSNGDGELCLSDDPTRCPDPSPIVGATAVSCQNLCGDAEFAVACSTIPGLPPWPTLPAACRSIAPTPGAEYFCCPCQ